MGMTVSEKILARACNQNFVAPDEILWANVDKAMMDDILGPRVEIDECMKKIHAQVWNPTKVVIISDHYTPPANIKQANIVKFTRAWAEENAQFYWSASNGLVWYFSDRNSALLFKLTFGGNVE